MRKSHKQKVRDKKRWRAWNKLFTTHIDRMVNEMMVEIDQDVLDQITRKYYPNANRNSEK